MIDKLIDLLRDFIGIFRFGAVVDTYENAIILRFGKLRKAITSPGFYWLAPFYIDRIISDTSVIAVRDMNAQLITMSCGTTISIKCIVSFKTSDPAKFFLEVDNAEAALYDAAGGTVRDVLTGMTWEDVSGDNGPLVTEKLTKAVRKIAWKYGIEVTQVAPVDLAKVRALRLITGV